MNNTTSPRPSRLHQCSAACGYCRATARLAALEADRAVVKAAITAESNVKVMRAVVAMRDDSRNDATEGDRQAFSLASDTARLFAMIDAFTPRQARMFATARKAI